ncbi:MAG: hypothetical protein FJW20_09240 [Acidimicrobiia bacterium]|nr:hypothetical protein [Acidimicrobiia bacterium]
MRPVSRRPIHIIGVVEPAFTGTEPGALTGIFTPTAMNVRAFDNPNWAWFRAWVRLHPNSSPEILRDKLQASFTAWRRERALQFGGETPKDELDAYIKTALSLEPAAAGVSGLQKKYRHALTILGALVALVLLIAAMNAANLMSTLVAAQVAFCFLVYFFAGLFLSSFDRITSQSPGFDHRGLLAVEIVSNADQPIPHWEQLATHIRALPGVESAGISGWSLMTGNATVYPIRVNGRRAQVEPYFLAASPGWLGTMRIPLLDGRDFSPHDVDPDAAIVNQTFARLHFHGRSPVGETFERGVPHRIVGLAADARPPRRPHQSFYLSPLRTTLPHIEPLLNDPSPRVRDNARRALSTLRSQ